MSKTKSITDQILQLQKENERLVFLNSLFEKAVKKEFGYSIKELHQLILKQEAYERRRAEKQGQQNQFTLGEN